MQDDDDIGGPVQNIRAAVCEIAELYAMKYTEDFGQLATYVTGVWELLGAMSSGTRDDYVSGRV